MESNMVCCICGNSACGRIKRKNGDEDDDDDMLLYYCKEHLRGHKNDESFFG
jgi:hypothetical protein